MDIVNKVYGLVVNESTVMVESTARFHLTRSNTHCGIHTILLCKCTHKTCILIYLRSCIYYVKHSTTSDQYECAIDLCGILLQL